MMSRLIVIWNSKDAPNRAGVHDLGQICSGPGQVDWFCNICYSINWRDNCCKVAIADVNGDGRLDVILSHSEKPGYPVSWYEAPLDPKRGEWREHPIGQVDYCHSLKAADFDGDGDVDLLAAEMPRYTPQDAPVVIFFNRNKGLKWEEEVLARTGSYSAQIGDIGNDGDPDIIGLRNFDRPPIEIWENLRVNRED